MQTINPGNTLALRFRALLENYSNVDVFAMGFPKNWEKEILWSIAINNP